MLRTLVLALLLFCHPALAAEWRFSDAEGKTLILPAPPERIIAHASVAAALIPYRIRPVGIMLDGPPSRDGVLEGLDITNIPVVSQGWFDIDAEAVLKLAPDLILTEYALAEGVFQGGTHEGPMRERLESIAPLVGMPIGNSTVETLEAYETLAKSLGANLDTPALTTAEADFTAARDAFKAAVSTKPGLTLIAASLGTDGLFIAAPDRFGDLNDLTTWGLDIPQVDAPAGSSYLSIPWESIADFEADILLLDDRWETSALDTIAAHPIGSRIPAVRAGQLGNWPAEQVRSYKTYADELEALTALIERSDPNLVD